jgi:hypothetical protein
VHAAVHNAGLTFDSRDDENRVADALAAQQMGEMLSGWPR